MIVNRKLTNHENAINFNKYENFLDISKNQAVKELSNIIEDQKIIYTDRIKKILNSKETISRKIRVIEDLDIKFFSSFKLTIKEYLHVVCLFALRQACGELKIKNPKRLSPEINSWISSISNTISKRYIVESNEIVTIPMINNIGKEVAGQKLIYDMQLLFDNIKEKKPINIINGLEGKALFRGRDLAVKLFNGDIKLENDSFQFASTEEILRREKVVAAQWSAILDSHVCELCASLDGKIISIDDPDYAFYSPGDMHIGCRCMWAYIKDSERPENRVVDWKTPSTKLLLKYSGIIINKNIEKNEEK